MTDEYKRCTKCHERKPLSAFYRKPRKPGEYRTICKACMIARDVLSQRKRRLALHPHGSASDDTRVFRLRACPDDPIMGVPMFRRGLAQFYSAEFHAMLSDSAIPEGSRWLYKPDGCDRPVLWEVRGCALHRVGGAREIPARRRDGY